MLTVFVVSDASGETVEQVARAALVQFSDARVRLLRRGPVRAEEQVRAVVREAAEGDSMCSSGRDT